MSVSIRSVGTALLAVAGIGACSSSSGPSSAGKQVSFQLATRPTAPAIRSASALAGTETIGVGNDTIVLTSVQVVLRRIELERAGGSVCDSLTTDDDCEDLKAGPVLLDLPLGAGAARSFTVTIDTGSYSQIKFQIHRPSSSHDAVFLAQNPDFDGVSIRAVGTWNGTPFTYTTDLEAEQETEFSPPISVTESTGASLTLFVDLAGWFGNGGTGLIDPNTATNGGGAAGDVKDNIEASFRAFEDDNRDGHDDHGAD